jgi:hypothetical protein
MRSTTHQWLLLWIARKMAADGFLIRGYDGPTPQGGEWNSLPRVFQVGGVRPDAWGMRTETHQMAIGEAKTVEDLESQHTQKQMRVFGRLLERGSSRLCRLYLATPRSGVYALDRCLARAELLGARHIVRLHIPDCLVEQGAVDYA